MEMPRLGLLEGRISEVEKEILETSQLELATENDSKDAISGPQGELWERIRHKNAFEKFTNFTEFELVCLYRRLVPFILNHRRRGPSPKIPFSDSLLILLIFYKTGLEFDELAIFVG